MHPRLLMLALLLGLLSMQFQPALAGDQVLRYSNNEAGNASPIILHADSITTWMEGHHRILLFKGHVLIDHGVITVRMDQGVASIDVQKLQTTNILHFDLYAEGEVKLEHGAVIQTGPSGVMQLNTRGELRLRSHVNKVLQQQQADDETYQRATKIWSAQGKRETTGYTRVMAYQDPPPPRPLFRPPGYRAAQHNRPPAARPPFFRVSAHRASPSSRHRGSRLRFLHRQAFKGARPNHRLAILDRLRYSQICKRRPRLGRLLLFLPARLFRAPVFQSLFREARQLSRRRRPCAIPPVFARAAHRSRHGNEDDRHANRRSSRPGHWRDHPGSQDDRQQEPGRF